MAKPRARCTANVGSGTHSDFHSEWPIITDWPAVVRGLRKALGKSQPDFAELLGLGRATVERWESGRNVPFKGQSLELLSRVRPHLKTDLQAGQALNLAAAAVLPHLTRPTAEYGGSHVAAFLKAKKHDHADLGPALLTALVDSRILVAIDPSGDPLEDTYFPLAARLVNPTSLPGWALELVDLLRDAPAADQRLLVDVARRLARSGRDDVRV